MIVIYQLTVDLHQFFLLITFFLSKQFWVQFENQFFVKIYIWKLFLNLQLDLSHHWPSSPSKNDSYFFNLNNWISISVNQRRRAKSIKSCCDHIFQVIFILFNEIKNKSYFFLYSTSAAKLYFYFIQTKNSWYFLFFCQIAYRVVCY